MKYPKIFYILVSGIILPLLVILLAIPAHAGGEVITLSPDEGEIGDEIAIGGRGFEVNQRYQVYFSSDKADEDDNIDTEVTAYTRIIRIIMANADGDLSTDYEFTVPRELIDGEDKEYVHGGKYYVYLTYYKSTIIRDVARFTVIGGEIEINLEKGEVGTEVEISGQRFGISQKITIEYDGNVIDITSGDGETDSSGEFTGTIIIPESTAGAHTITVSDVAGNEPEAEFSVQPKITIAPTSGAVGDEIQVSGTGFGGRANITLTVDAYRTSTTPLFLRTNRNGSFIGSFLVPSYAIGTSRIEIKDGTRRNWAEANLLILAGASLTPATSQASPGYVGLELTIYGTGFIIGSEVTITYDDIRIETATADTGGDFRTTFTVPPSAAGHHTITATDGTNTFKFTFTMEAEAPAIPVPLLPGVATTAEPEAYFDWEDVTDSSGITYALQIGTDADFTTIVLEKEGLAVSEYTITKEERLKSTEADAPYYWKVRAIDGAANEGKWTIPELFYVGLSQTATPSWTLYMWIGLGVLLFGILGLWVLRRIRD